MCHEYVYFGGAARIVFAPIREVGPITDKQQDAHINKLAGDHHVLSDIQVYIDIYMGDVYMGTYIYKSPFHQGGDSFHIVIVGGHQHEALFLNLKHFFVPIFCLYNVGIVINDLLLLLFLIYMWHILVTKITLFLSYILFFPKVTFYLN